MLKLFKCHLLLMLSLIYTSLPMSSVPLRCHILYNINVGHFCSATSSLLGRVTSFTTVILNLTLTKPNPNSNINCNPAHNPNPKKLTVNALSCKHFVVLYNLFPYQDHGVNSYFLDQRLIFKYLNV